MNAKHTPGPWRVDGRYVMALKEKQICEAPAYGVVHGKVDAANANLIAAAPELLNALKALLIRVADDEDYGPDHAVTVARASIAKATGGAK